MRRFHWLAQLAACSAALLAACGGTTSEEPEKSASVPDEAGCTPGSCGAGQECVGSTECNAVWRCEEASFTRCSAAAPFVACGCDGRFVTIAAGCSGRHAWRAPASIGADYLGSPCPVDSPIASTAILPPLDLVYQGRELHEFEGSTVRVRILDLMTPPPAAFEVARVIQGGAFDFAWPALGQRFYSYFNAQTLIDGNGDGDCDADELILLARIPNPFQLAAETATLTISPANFSEFPSSCARWNE